MTQTLTQGTMLFTVHGQIESEMLLLGAFLLVVAFGLYTFSIVRKQSTTDTKTPKTRCWKKILIHFQ